MVSLGTYIGALFLGLAASLAPCLFPVLPSFIAFIVRLNTKELEENTENTEDAPEKSSVEKLTGNLRGALAGVLVMLGIMTVFVVLGFILTGILGFFSDNYRRFALIQGIILVLAGIFLALNVKLSFGKIDVASDKITSNLRKIDNPWLLSYLIGLSFAVLAAPCAIVVFGTLFALIADSSLSDASLIMIVFSLGAGSPFIIWGAFADFWGPHLQKHIGTIQKYVPIVTGIMIIIVGILQILVGLKIDIGIDLLSS